MASGEPFLAAFLQVLLGQLESLEMLSYARREGFGKHLDKWRKTLSRIETVLDDAQEKQSTEWVVKAWLDDLRDLAYDVEDVLDGFATEALRCKLTGEDDQANTSKIRNLFPTCCTRFTPHAVKINIRLGSNIAEITDRFNDLVMREAHLRLKETADGGRHQTPTYVMTDAHVYGREKDKEAILQLLLGEKCSDAGVSVIPILGMGGIGKTTLAQLVYNDEEVQSCFEVKAWSCVSEDFNVDRVTKTILQSLTPDNCDGKDRNWLQVKLKEELQGKKFLVVLDDLWNENYDDWTILRAPFLAGAPGSAIVITTRNQRVSSMTGTIPTYRLEVLLNDACLSVFTQHALGASNFNGHPELQEIGEKIVERAKGLPSAAKTLGGLLRAKKDRNVWEDVLKSKLWAIPGERSGILPALMLSYDHLPSHLKRCFAYCSIFPMDYEFEEKQLVLLWMAEGLIQPQGDEQMEDLGSKYFHNLLFMSFFQRSSFQRSRMDGSQFVMHDLINDLAQWVAGDICFVIGDRIKGSQRRLPKKARHSSYLGGQYDSIRKFEVFFELTCLRTFLPLMLPSPGQCYLTHNVPLQLLPKLLCLRVLSLSGYYIVELPNSIGDLKHLRYLDLSYTQIRGLPESTTTLYNLQTLILENCHYLKKLPSKFGNLVNLRHLNILNAYNLEGMPPQMHKLACLRTLSNLIVGKGNCFALKELGSLLHLRGTLIISRLENVIEPMDAKLIEKPNLTALCLEWGVNVDGSQDRTRELQVLNMLQPHMALKELTIRCYGGTKFSTWVGDPSFPNMVLLRIENCKECTSLPTIGQLPSLKDLFVGSMDSVKNVGHEFYGNGCSQPFRSLETLRFDNMKEWENWIPIGEFPKLRELSIKNCPKLLGKLPNYLPSLQTFLVEECQRLVVSISSFPKLCELQIEGSKGMVRQSKVDFSSLHLSSLSTISEFTFPPIEGLLLEGLTHVEDLAFENCEELAPLWSNDVGLLQPLPNLCVLRFDNCPNLVSLVAEKANEQPQSNLPSRLGAIHISSCNALESLPKAVVYSNTCLEYIYINGCDLLKQIAIGQLPQTLKRLHIESCKNMVILVDEDDTNGTCSSSSSLLEHLEISQCPSLKSLITSGELPTTLKCLMIRDCSNLESIAMSFHHNLSLEKIVIENCENLVSLPMGIHTLSHLDTIDILSCPALVSFPDSGLLPRNLRLLRISDMALPNCIHSITSLQNLQFWSRPSVVSSFPEGGFPASLISLDIRDCNIIEALLEWGLHRLTSLQQVKIRGGCLHLEYFPEKMLPASLTSLTIECFHNLKYLSSEGFRNLTSLEELYIGECENLTSFPKDGLPASLQILNFRGCPLLKESCKKDEGREWSKIAYIPYILIDHRFIYDPEE